MSAHPSEKEIIHSEFELERVILFSDAVFAFCWIIHYTKKTKKVQTQRRDLKYFS